MTKKDFKEIGFPDITDTKNFIYINTECSNPSKYNTGLYQLDYKKIKDANQFKRIYKIITGNKWQ